MHAADKLHHSRKRRMSEKSFKLADAANEAMRSRLTACFNHGRQLEHPDAQVGRWPSVSSNPYFAVALIDIL